MLLLAEYGIPECKRKKQYYADSAKGENHLSLGAFRSIFGYWN